MARNRKLLFLIPVAFVGAGLLIYKDLIFRDKPAYASHEGKKLLDADLSDVSGAPLKLTSLIEKSGNEEKIILALWATWCDPCTREIPVIQRKSAEFQKAGVQVHLVNYDGPVPDKALAEVKAWLISQKITLPTYFEFGEQILKTLNVNGLPFVVGLGRDLKISWMELGELDWEDTAALVARFK